MRAKVQELLEMIGIPVNEILVFEDTEITGSFFYPNSVESTTYSGNFTDEQLLIIFEDMIEDHIKTVTEELQMIQRYRKMFYGENNTEDESGSDNLVF